MKKFQFVKLFLCSLFVFSIVSTSAGQRRSTVKTKPKPVVFAVINDGKMVEPIAFIDKGELVQALDGAEDGMTAAVFARTYYKPKTVYRLVFGGADAGSVSIIKNDPKAECSSKMADVSYASQKAKLKGKVMSLATDAPVKRNSGVRRLPTPAERAEIESLVRAEFVKQKVSSEAAKNLKYHNLTALDVDADGKAEMVGSFWVEPSATTRSLLFFIAEKNAAGKYEFGYSEFRSVTQDEVMSGEISDLDEGVLHELLLDALEYDGDTTAEIFTYAQSFEGANFAAYSRRGGKWVKAFEGYSYRCGY
jgi:hypothetical protein